MALKLRPTTRDIEGLMAKAASGRSGVSKKAQAELQRLKTAELQRELGR